MSNVVYLCNGLLAIKKDALTYHNMDESPEDFMLSEIIQTHKAKYHRILPTRGP